jgi:serine/threonine-protein kinase
VSAAASALQERALVLDRYRPLRPVGRGGSGSVWLARDERTGLEVALKIVPREGKRAARAMREMEAASRLRHERCVRAYDFGGDTGHVYIAYEYVRGATMRELLRTGKLSDADAVEVCAQVLDALAHAHARGIVHRDVKPSNVLLEETPEVSARLLDFGLAQFDEADTLTAIGDVPGTLAYISPERLSGGEATAASDVWAVGVMLWEALAGKHPFWGVPLPQVGAAIEAGAAPLGQERADLPGPLLAVIGRALETAPSRRPAARELAALLREAPLRRAPRSPERAARKRQRTQRQRPQQPEQPDQSVRTRVTLHRHTAPGVRALAAAGTGLVALVGAGVLPFWPPVLVVGLALAAAMLSLRLPRAALALALFTPLFPLGNVASGAAVAYGVLALGWLALSWRDPRAGICFAAGPLLAALGALMLLPLAVQPARGAARKALHAFTGVLAAAAVAGLHGDALPLTGARSGNLGVSGTESPGDVLQAVVSLLGGQSALVTTGLALAVSAVLLRPAAARGLWGIAALGAGQMALVLLAAPGIPAASVVIGSWALCAVLGALTMRASR